LPPSDSFNNTLRTYTTIEGPVWIDDGLYVSELLGPPNPPPSRILKLEPPSTVSIAVTSSGSNGLATDDAGTLWAAVHADGSISRINLQTGARSPLVSMYMGARFNSPNDLALRSDGTIYFSDPDYQAPDAGAQTQTRVYRIAPGTNAVTVVDATLSEPNGVTLSLDEATLYVSSSTTVTAPGHAPGGVYAYPVMPDGSTGPRPATPFSTLNIDGMAIDCAGNIYGAQIGTGNVVVLDPLGTPVAGSPIVVSGVASVTNTAFGGSDHKTLYISAQGQMGQQGLFQVVLGVPGLPY
jgi:gluconolactonase